MNFFKTFLASILGTFVALSLLMIVGFSLLLSSASEPEPHIRPNTVLTMQLSGNIPARSIQDPVQELFSGTTRRVSLPMLKENLEKAAVDERIAGVWITISRLGTSWTTLEAARGYLQDFREQSGKFVYVNTDDIGMNESAYFLASAADSIFFPPETMFEFNGFAIQTSFYSGLLEKLGIDPQISRAGRYKSAVEPFLQTESSPENREQLTAILDHVTETFLSAVEASRGVTAENLDQIMNSIPADPVANALRTGLIDEIAYRHEVEAMIRKRLGLDEDESIRTVGMARYDRVSDRSAGRTEPDTDDRIAVIHASGMIVPQAVESPFSSEPMITERSVRRSLDAALENDQVKAIVIHIDSGGGAVSTSEHIYARIREAAEKKPVIASMGGVAASGGYYIAMGAGRVVAAPSTITGSIGVYNLLFDTSDLYNDHLGIYFETFKSHEHADLFHMTRPLTGFEQSSIQQGVDAMYDRFLEVVSEARGMSRQEVDRVAQGRVWTGADAYRNGLVDQLGTLDDAVALAAGEAGIESYRIITYPEPKDLFELLFQSADSSVRAWVRSLVPGGEKLHRVESVLKSPAAQNWAILPVEFHID